MLDKKQPKMGGGLDFSGTVNLSFPKKNHKISLYTKNQQNSMKALEDMSQNVDFGPKKGKFGPKRAQNGWNQIFPGTFTRLFHKYAKLRRSYDSFPRNWQKCQFLG